MDFESLFRSRTPLVRDRKLQATWALLFWPTSIAEVDRKPMLSFATEISLILTLNCLFAYPVHNM